MTDLKTLKQLIKLMVDNDLTELDLEGEGEKVKLRRGDGGTEGPRYVMSAPPTGGAPAHPQPAPAAAPAKPEFTGDGQLDENLITINSPMVGTFYSSPTPDAKPFVAVGDSIDSESVVCIIEAMKVFNEIKAEQSGTIEKILIASGQAVEFGEPLFAIKPD